MDTTGVPMILFWIHVAAAAAGAVLPPTNVTLQCHNMQNTVSWGYEGSLEGLKFKVWIGSITREPVTRFVDPPVMSADLSEFSDPDNDGYMVMVFAVKEGVESAPEPKEGIEYSYFKDSPAAVKCSLDLPLVNVTALEENHLHFSFTHPGVLYPTSRRLRKRKSHDFQDRLPMFEYHVEVQNQASHLFDCKERECQDKLHVHGNEKSYCLSITGEMKKMSVRTTKKFCSKPLGPPGINPLAYSIPIALVLIGVFIGSMVFVKKTRASVSGPSSLAFPERSRPSRPENLAPLVNSGYSLVSPVSPTPPTPSEQNTSNGSSTFREEEVMRLPIGVPENENDNEPEAEVAAGEQEASEDGYSLGNCLENNEYEPRRAYERRETPANSTQN